jgi:2-oxoglutarate dehydrogenase E2 component (dihydrolipoamide succinyltransferase)
MIAEITVPEVGESITEGVLVEWMQEDGELVRSEDPLFELETDKITMTIAAQHSGKLAIQVPAESTVQVGQVVGTIDTDAADEEAAAAPQEPALPAAEPAAKPEPAAEPAAEPAPATEPAADLDDLAPAVRRLVAEHGLDPASIQGTGKGGRLTKEDVLRRLSDGEQEPQGAGGAPPASPSAPRQEVREERTKMSTLGRRMAERLVQAQQTAAILTTFNEADMTNVMAMRARFRGDFEQRHGVRLGFMSFFVKAAVDALQKVPIVNARIDGEEIVKQHFYDIGVAVSTPHGLVVPVVRDADRLSFAELEAAIADLAGKARDRKLTLDQLTGGTFTISNGGVYGSLLSTPILNTPQSAILGMHAIKKRPAVVGDQVLARPMMYLALSYDHRLVDGEQAVTFLRRIVECIEDPERMMLQT